MSVPSHDRETLLTSPLPEGVYESLRTAALDSALAQLADLTPRFAAIEAADEPHVLARHVAKLVERALSREGDTGRRLALVNDLLARVAEQDEQVIDRRGGAPRRPQP